MQPQDTSSALGHKGPHPSGDCHQEAALSATASPLSQPSLASHSSSFSPPPPPLAFVLLQIIKQFFPAVLHSSASCKNFNVFIFAIRGKALCFSATTPHPPTLDPLGH